MIPVKVEWSFMILKLSFELLNILQYIDPFILNLKMTIASINHQVDKNNLSNRKYGHLKFLKWHIPIIEN